MAAHGVSAARLAENTAKWVIMIGLVAVRDLVSKGVTPTLDDVWSYSQWRGYLEKPDGIDLKSGRQGRGQGHPPPHIRPCLGR